MINKGMVNKGKYWIFEKIRVHQYPISKILRVLIRVSSTRFHSNLSYLVFCRYNTIKSYWKLAYCSYRVWKSFELRVSQY